MSPTFELTARLLERASVTPDDAGCQALLIERLSALDFVCETFCVEGVTTLWAIRRGTAKGPTFVFAGHTDVVPPGPLEAWHTPPFTPTVREGKLYGRGAADMKTSLAAFLVATEEYLTACPNPIGSLAFLITSDEEGPALHGTAHAIRLLSARGEQLDYCIVGEPTCVEQIGDTFKNGRRGSLSGRLLVQGVQGHIAYPHLARNPIHTIAPVLADLAQTAWDEGDADFPPTSWQISNFHAGTGATNVIPGQACIDFNFRFSPASPATTLKARVEAIFEKHGLLPEKDYSITWTLSGEPFFTPKGALCSALTQAIEQETGITPQCSTTGGTSDGRFIATLCPQVVEFGPVNASIHQVNECVDINSIETLKNIYRRVLEKLGTLE